MTERISRFLAEHSPETPCLVIDLDVIAEAYEALRWYLPLARIYYAVKANPAAEIVSMLEGKGAGFDVASRGEIELCLANGFAPEMAVDLLRKARELGLDPYGVSFHVGSQQTDLGQWDGAVGAAARMFSLLAEADINLQMINLGGGFPAHYRGEVPEIDLYAQAVMAAITRYFGNDLPEIIIEPGRSLVGDAGVIQSEVVLISEKGGGDVRRWVYLDVGKFNGLAETMDESIKYRILTPGRRGSSGPV